MNNLELLNYLKTKAITQKTTNLGVFEIKELVPMWVIEEAIKSLKDPFDYVEPCEPDCSTERHAYHQGQWDMASRMAGEISNE